MDNQWNHGTDGIKATMGTKAAKAPAPSTPLCLFYVLVPWDTWVVCIYLGSLDCLVFTGPTAFFYVALIFSLNCAGDISEMMMTMMTS